MRKFFLFANTTLKTTLTYRLNFVLWRMRHMFSLILLFFLWNQAFINRPDVAGFTKPMMITYIFLSNFMNAVVLSTRTDQVAADIRDGRIINQLLKPFNYWISVGAREFADKITNIIFSIIELIIFVVIFQPEVFIATNGMNYLGFIFFVVIALILSFSISSALALIAFWTAEIWAARFIYMVFISLIAGTLFPLDIFPKYLYDAFLWTPGPYLIYVPIKVLIHGLNEETLWLAVKGLGWVCITFVLVQGMWRKGLKDFSFFGR